MAMACDLTRIASIQWERAADKGVTGQAVTPFVLAFLHRESGGRTERANLDLIADNVALAGGVAVAYAALSSSSQ